MRGCRLVVVASVTRAVAVVPSARPMDFETYIDIDALEPEAGRRPQTPRLRLLRAMVAVRAIGRMHCLSVSRFRRPPTAVIQR